MRTVVVRQCLARIQALVRRPGVAAVEALGDDTLKAHARRGLPLKVDRSDRYGTADGGKSELLEACSATLPRLIAKPPTFYPEQVEHGELRLLIWTRAAGQSVEVRPAPAAVHHKFTVEKEIGPVRELTKLGEPVGEVRAVA